MPARYYDPASARFVSVDPAAPSAGDPVSLNGYSYCFGDPVSLVDPDGRDVLYGEYYSDEQDPTGELDANLPDHDGAGVGKPPSEKVWKANNAVAAQQGARASREAEERLVANSLAGSKRVLNLNVRGPSGFREMGDTWASFPAATVHLGGISAANLIGGVAMTGAGIALVAGLAAKVVLPFAIGATIVLAGPAAGAAAILAGAVFISVGVVAGYAAIEAGRRGL